MHTEYAFTKYVELILSLSPRSVLDVGCGNGGLLLACRESGVPAIGLEVTKDRVEELRARGLDVRRVDAARLGCPDETVDVVSIRHVLHHLPDPVTAVREAARAAQRYVVIAEPHFDTRLPGQKLAQDVDTWSKWVHTARGAYHVPGLTPAALINLVESCELVVERITVEQHLERVVATEAIQQHWDEHVTKLPAGHGLRTAGEALARRAKGKWMTPPGSLILVARK